MPRKCCVPTCKSNYTSVLKAGESAQSTFRFPPDETLKRKWLDTIPRKGWIPTKNSCVCARHFKETDIIRYDKYLQADGSYIQLALTNPKLAKGAVPCVFPDLAHRPSMGTKQKRSRGRINFNSLTRNLTHKVQLDGWQVRINDNCLYMHTSCFDHRGSSVVNSVFINEDLSVKVFLKNSQLSVSDLSWILSPNMKLTRWSQLESILARYKSEEVSISSSEEYYHNCTECAYTTRFKFTMKNHLMTHNLSKRVTFDCVGPMEPLKCSQCANFNTHDLADLKLHCRAGHALLAPEEVKPYGCESCLFRTFSRYLYLRHKLYNMCMRNWRVKSEETVPGEMKESEIGDQKETVETSGTTFQCSHCSYKLRSQCSLDQHVKILHPKRRPKIFTCELCEYTTEDKQKYKRHVLIKHTQDRGRLRCEHCPYETKYARCLKTHIITHHTDPEKIQWFNCEHCSYRGKTRSYLRVHISEQHLSRPSLKCPHCPFVTKLKRYLRNHVLCKHTEVEKIQCAQCPYKSKNRRTLNDHFRWKHGDAELLKCEQCPFVTKFTQALRNHVLWKHTQDDKIQWYGCTQCPYKSKTSSNLRLHVRNRHAEREFLKCGLCPFQTKYAQSLKNHVTGQHEQLEKPLTKQL